MVSRIHYASTCVAKTTKGKRCRCLAIPNERTCVLHLPRNDPRRIAYMADHSKRVKAAAERRKLARAVAAAAESGMSVIAGPIVTKAA